jgi:hypothetical protein
MRRPRYDAEEADSSRRQSERALLPSPPNRAVPSSDDAPVYPIQSETSAGRLPASHFSVGRPLGSQFSQVPADPQRARTDYSWSPPSSSGDPRTPPHSARPSVQWSPTGTTFHDANPNAQHSSYYSQPQPHSTASSHVNPRELYFTQHQYARTGAPGWTPRTPTSPEIADRRISAAHPLSSMTPNQPPYTSPYIDDHRREEYNGGAPRGS